MESEQTNSKIKFTQLLTRKQLILVVSFFILLNFIFYRMFFSPIHFENNEQKIFLIKKGESLSTITSNL